MRGRRSAAVTCVKRRRSGSKAQGRPGVPARPVDRPQFRGLRPHADVRPCATLGRRRPRGQGWRLPGRVTISKCLVLSCPVGSCSLFGGLRVTWLMISESIRPGHAGRLRHPLRLLEAAEVAHPLNRRLGTALPPGDHRVHTSVLSFEQGSQPFLRRELVLADAAGAVADPLHHHPVLK